jgi:hypothetical protein
VTWGLGMTPPNLQTLGNVTAIVVGVIIASIGEIKFVFIGFVCAMLGVVFEATRLAMVERLLSSSEFKMDPLVTLYYFAPVCALMNGCVALFRELPYLTMDKVMDLGLFTLLLNASVAFLLNVSVVFLVRPSCIEFCPLTCADRQDLGPRPDAQRRAQGHPPRARVHGHLPRPRLAAASIWLQHCPCGARLLQAWRR